MVSGLIQVLVLFKVLHRDDVMSSTLDCIQCCCWFLVTNLLL